MNAGLFAEKLQILSMLLKYVSQNAIILSSFCFFWDNCVYQLILYSRCKVYKWVGIFFTSSFQSHFEKDHWGQIWKGLTILMFFWGIILCVIVCGF